MTDVRPKKGGPYSLYCYDCCRWIPNTANSEMRKETYLAGGFAHSHLCGKAKNGEIIILGEEGIPIDEHSNNGLE